MLRAIVLAVLLLALAAAPLAAQEAAEAPDEARNPTRIVTMYPHVFSVGPGTPMPGNTQFPDGEEDFSRGFAGGCLDGATEAIVAGCGSGDAGNVLYVYSTAGFVHGSVDFWSYEDFHNERGQAKDILLDTTQDITATFYMSADAHSWAVIDGNPANGVPNPYPAWNWDPGVHPDWQVEATLFLGSMGEYQGQASEPPPVHEKVLSGEVTVVAQGITEPTTIVSLDENLGGEGEVVEFAINLGKPQVDRIPKEADWILRFRWWSTTSGNTYITPRMNWNVNSGEFYPNRFTLPVKNPFDVELVFPQFLHDKLLLHAMLNSPWGSYDVDARSVALEVLDEGGRPAPLLTLARNADFSVAHGGHYKPVNITWVWDYKADRAPPGVYKATVSAWNFQHSAQSVTEARFRINADGTGTVLEVGRSGQQTGTGEQLGLPGAGGSGADGDHAQPLAWLRGDGGR